MEAKTTDKTPISAIAPACSSKKSNLMVWTEAHDVMLCREIIAVDPFTQSKKGTTNRSAKWTEIVDHLSEVQTITFKVDNRAVHDRYNLWASNLRKKLKKEAKESGIVAEMSESEEALQFLIEREDASEEIRQDGLQKKQAIATDRMGAEEVRRKAMEKLGETRKRKVERGDNEKGKKRRSNGNETVVYLRGKNEQRMSLEKDRMELEEKKIEAENKRHDEFMVVMQQQQQQQMQSFHMIMAQHQQQMKKQQTQQEKQQAQQSEVMLKLFSMFANK